MHIAFVCKNAEFIRVLDFQYKNWNLSLFPRLPVQMQPTDKTYTFTDVTQDYFDDAVFIGDSRTVGLRDYGGWDNATYYASIGLTVYDMFDTPIVEENGAKITIEKH